jgi:hypothetical protein
MAPVKSSQDPSYQPFGLFAAVLTAALLPLPAAHSQALHVSRIGVATELLLVTQPLSEATTVAWPLPDGTVMSTTSGGLTLAVDVQEALSGFEVVPPVVVAVGGAQPSDLRPVLEIGLDRRIPEPVATPPARLVEGGVDRRLGEPGSEALLRLEMALPGPDDWRRSTVEVLWELLPELLATELPGLVSRIEGDLGRLDARVDPELAEVKLRQLRLQLARLAEDPRLDSSRVETSRRRLQVRRQALTGIHPDGAAELVRLWLAGGVTAVREFLFGVEGVTLESIRDAARRWLPQHPGHAVLLLPPRVFNPRFAPGPERVQLANDVVAVVLERPGAGLSAVCLQPVLVPDVDGRLTGTVLARLAAEVRSSAGAPGWVRIQDEPPLLELAAPAEDVSELIEVLQTALARVAGDDRPVTEQDPGARRRALHLMGRLLGLTESVGLSPSELLQPGNLALGVVAPDSEAAVEALRKFRIGGGPGRSRPASRALDAVPRTREAAPGDDSALVVSFELYPSGDEVAALVVGAVIERRARRLLADAQVEVLRPLVPGRTVLLLTVRAPATLDEVESLLLEAWEGITEPVEEIEIADIRRRLAAEVASRTSGPVGQARRCAAVAAGSVGWRLPSDLERELLTTAPDVITEALTAVDSFDRLENTGAGMLPIPEVESP